jgi:hypothetical protein
MYSDFIGGGGWGGGGVEEARTALLSPTIKFNSVNCTHIYYTFAGF